MKQATWFTEMGEQFAQDPEYVAYGMMLDLTARICEQMQRQGLNRSQLAQRLGVSRQRVTRFLNAPTNTSLVTLVKFAQALGLEVRVSLEPAAAPAAQDQQPQRRSA